jgi:hypothetical protein
MLSLFKKYEVRATWAAIGLLLFDNKRDLLDHLPVVRPGYVKPNISPYTGGYIEGVGENERTDPYHFGASLARQIAEVDGMELASHTFSHFYCLEAGQDENAFRADLEASIMATERISVRPTSLVFPRHQLNEQYLPTCARLGFKAYRGNPVSWMYRASPVEKQSWIHRAVQIADGYFDLSGSNAFLPLTTASGLVNVPASRYFKPYNRRFRKLAPLRLGRIKQSMTAAAIGGQSFHLWWHPDDFGVNQTENLTALESVLRHYVILRERYGVRSMTMNEISASAELTRKAEYMNPQKDTVIF